MLAINCMPDHTHLFVGFNPNILISDFVKEIKVESNEFITNKKWIKGKFSWQNGYGIFSYSHSQINRVIRYILNQEAHHRKKTFKKEYHELLENLPFHLRKNICLISSIRIYCCPGKIDLRTLASEKWC